ncbi:hypothetical protein [Halovenus salina]|uniref:hypothetical protein n=1 Tax=Halovenus salina TaxID=1510225 RepID=UPI0022609165|nr:hypothetical protein [Halovenus salina]
MTCETELDTDHMSAVDARAAEHLVDLDQTHLDARFWGTDTPHPRAGGGQE